MRNIRHKIIIQSVEGMWFSQIESVSSSNQITNYSKSIGDHFLLLQLLRVKQSEEKPVLKSHIPKNY